MHWPIGKTCKVYIDVETTGLVLFIRKLPLLSAKPSAWKSQFSFCGAELDACSMKGDLLACFLSCLWEVGMQGAVSLCSGDSSKRCCMHALKKVGQGVQKAESSNQRVFLKRQLVFKRNSKVSFIWEQDRWVSGRMHCSTRGSFLCRKDQCSLIWDCFIPVQQLGGTRGPFVLFSCVV